MKILKQLQWGDPVLVVPLEDVPENVERSQGCGYGVYAAYPTPEEAANHIERRPQSFSIGFARGPKSTVRGSDMSKYVVAVWAKDVGVHIKTLNYGTAPAPKKIKDWPHDCPRCKGRECALIMSVTIDCKNGCYR